MSSSVAKSNEVADPQGGQQFDTYFVRQLQRASSQIKLIDLVTGLAQVLVVLLGGLLLVCVADAWLTPLPRWLRLAVLGGILVYTGLVIARHLIPLILWRINPAYAARMIEHSSPGLKNSLLNYLFLRSLPAAQRGAVYGAVRQRAAQDLANIAIDSSIDRTRLIRIGFALVGVVLAAGMYKLLSPKDPVQSLRRVFAPLADLPAPSRVQIVQVEPGSVELFFGESLEVRAEIRGANDATNPQILYTSDDGQFVAAAAPLNPGERPYEFRGVLAPTAGGIQQSLTYWVVAGDGRSSSYRVQLRPAPTIAVSAVEVQPPAYSELPTVRHDGLGDVDGLEGSRVRLSATANMPIASAYMEFLRVRPRSEQGPLTYQSLDRLALQAQGSEARGEFQLPRLVNPLPFTHYRIRFTTAAGQTSGEGSAYAIKIRPDLAPELNVEQPAATDVTVPANSKLPLAIRAADPDFKLTSLWLYVAHKGKILLQQNLPFEPPAGVGNVAARFALRPDAIGLKAGDEAVLYVIAKDNRHALSGTLDPNQTRSPNYTLKIVTGPRESNPKGSNESGQSASGRQAPNGTAAESEPSAPGQSGKGGGQADSNPEGDESDQHNEGGNSGSSESSQEADDSNGDSESGNSSGNMTSAGGESGQQPSQPGEQSGGAEGDAAADSAATNSGQGNGSQAGSPSEQANPSTSPPGESSSPPGGQPNPADAGTAGAGGEASAESGEAGPDENAPLNDFSSEGQRMERLLRRAQDQQQRPDRSEIRSHGGIDEPDQPPATEDNSNANPSSSDRSPGANDSGKSQSSDGSPGSEPNSNQAAGENSNPGEPGQPGMKPNESTASNSGKSPQGNSSSAAQGSHHQQKPGAQEDRAQGDGETEPLNPDNKPAPADPSQPSGDSESAGGSKGTNSRGNNSQGNHQSGEQGADGEKSADGAQGGNGKKDPNGEKGAQGEPAPTDDSGNRGQGETEGTDPQPPTQPDATQGDSPKGAGEQGGEDQPPSDGNNSQGDSSAEKPAAGESTSPPRSNANNVAPRPEGKTGQSAPAGESGASEGASQGEPRDASSLPEAGGSEAGSSAGNSKSAAADNRAQSEKSPPRGDRSGSQGEPKQSGAGSEFNPTDDDPTEREELEASRAATDLVLDYLRDQQQRPDPSLLNEMNWTEGEMREFLRRWETMRREADSGNPEAVKKFEESLRSLGLTTQPAQVRRNAMRNETIHRLQEDSAISRPPSARELQFREFLRRRSAADNQ